MGTTMSQGSRNDAHSLDDLRERWLIKRQLANRLQDAPVAEPPEPKFKKPKTHEETETMAHRNRGRIDEIDLELLRLRSQRSLPRALYTARVIALEEEKVYRKAIARELHHTQNGLRKDKKTDAEKDEIMELNQALGAQRRNLRRLNDEVAQLEQAFAEGNELTPDEARLIGAIRRGNWPTILGVFSKIAGLQEKEWYDSQDD